LSGGLLVLGASSGIGLALLQLASNKGWQAIGVSRQSRPFMLADDIIWQQQIYQRDDLQPLEAAIDAICQQYQPQLVIICHGLLQQDQVKAEKSIRQLEVTAAEQSWWVNYLVPMLHLQAIWPYLLQHPCKVLVLSAKVGSITDNQLGGWYSYRAAKAALNMAVKTAAIELQRQQKNTLIATVHPGTTDTQLAAPFTKNIPAGQLQTPESTALRLWQVAEHLKPEDHGALLNWDGTQLPY
jgi:NAD(P)-dependent dehydrogenase (short-subunit alcohol dehydrogenase family)